MIMHLDSDLYRPPSSLHPAYALLVVCADKSEEDVDVEADEEEEEDASGSIAAVVERSLLRAVKSKGHGGHWLPCII